MLGTPVGLDIKITKKIIRVSCGNQLEQERWETARAMENHHLLQKFLELVLNWIWNKWS